MGQRGEVGAITSAPAEALAGDIRVPGDKSISHRALICGAVAVGETAVSGLLASDDVLRTAAALRALGAEIEPGGDGVWRIWGRGIGGLVEPEAVLDMGNSGTGARLLMGLLATHPLTSFLTGDASLCRRPMARVVAPLERMGANFLTRDGGRLPMAVLGTDEPLAVEVRLEVPSAQVKSAILLAALNTPGRTTVIEPVATRDHTERLLAQFGVEVAVEGGGDGNQGAAISLVGQPEMTGRQVGVAADPSSAAFPTVAALLVPGSDVVLRETGVNPTRIGLYETLLEMGATLEIRGRRELGGEPVADIAIHGAGRLEGVRVPAERAPRMIDEYPVLAVAAACARGTTRLEGLAELRVKESDRIAAVAEGLARCGVEVEAGEDYLVVDGCAGPPPGPGPDEVIATHMDHRIAMAFLVLGAAAARPVTIDDGAMIDTSFPGFVGLMNGLGCRLEAAGAVP